MAYGSGSSGKGGFSRRGDKKQRLRTAKGRSTASQQWLARQLNDPYVAMAKREGYRSRAAYKLLELDKRFRIFSPHQCVVDLGAAPGGWSQVAAERVKAKGDSPDAPEGAKPAPSSAKASGGKVVAIDLLPMSPLGGVTCLQADFTDEEAQKQVIEALGGRKANIVLSDMAPNTTGHAGTDHIRILALVEEALTFAIGVLAPGGVFVAKVWQGGAERGLLDMLKKHFREVKHAKPPASRKDSAETYVVAKGFRK